MKWKAVVGFDGQYEVSNAGGVRRVGSGRGSVAGRLIKQKDHAQGYKVVSLWRGNKGTSALVHRVVAAAFLGPCPDGCEVNHRDGSKANNAVGNLEYVSRTQNIRHAMDTGLMRLVGTDNPASKLTEQQVLDIREMHAAGTGYKTLAKLYDVSPELIRNIIKGRIWRHLLGKTE